MDSVTAGGNHETHESDSTGIDEAVSTLRASGIVALPREMSGTTRITTASHVELCRMGGGEVETFQQVAFTWPVDDEWHVQLNFLSPTGHSLEQAFESLEQATRFLVDQYDTP